MENLDADSGMPRKVPYLNQRLVNLPLGGGDSAVLVGIGITHHDLLGVTPYFQESPIGLHLEQLRKDGGYRP